MSGGIGRTAIAQMLRIPRPRRYRPLWIGLVVAAAVGGVAIALGGAVAAVGGGLAGAAGVVVAALMLGRLWSWLAVAVGLGVGLGMVPLLGVLGFELAVITSALAAIMGVDVGSALARQMQRELAQTPRLERFRFPLGALAHGAGVAVLVVVAILLVPAAIAAVRGLWVPTCDWLFGIAAYLALPIATGVLAAALGFALGVAAGPRRFVGAFLAQLPAIAVALAALYRFYSEPPVFTYNAILGFFPGNLYDENVQLQAALAWSRIEQAAWVLAVFALVATRLDVPTLRVRLRSPRPGASRPLAYALAVLGIAGGLALHYHSGDLGYAIDAADIQAELGGRRETAHFIIHYAKTKEIEAEIDLIAADHELRYAQVVAQIGVAPSRKLRSYYFASRDQKYRWFGARNVEMAKPWLGDIYLDHRSFPHGSLRHEIAHAIAGEFGDPIFGVASRRVLGVPVFMSPALIEGLAVALAWPMGDHNDPHESVRVMQENGQLPRLDRLFGLQFFAVSSARGYATAGSFLRFLLDRYGAEKLRAVYQNGGDFEAAYGVPRAQLAREWSAMLAAIHIPKKQVKASEERFRFKSVFQRPCPHAIAKRREQAARSSARGNSQQAVALQRRVCADAPEEPRYILELGDYLIGVDAIDEALALWTGVANDTAGVTSSLRADALERMARVIGHRGDLAKARELVEAARALPIESADRRGLDAMAFALDHTGPAGPSLRAYFFGARFIPSIVHAALALTAEPELGLAQYLYGLQAAARREWQQSAIALERALARGLPNEAFTQNAARRLAVAAYRVRDRARLSVAITVLGGTAMTSGDRLLAKDWLDRMSFDATGAVTTSR